MNTQVDTRWNGRVNNNRVPTVSFCPKKRMVISPIGTIDSCIQNSLDAFLFFVNICRLYLPSLSFILFFYFSLSFSSPFNYNDLFFFYPYGTRTPTPLQWHLPLIPPAPPHCTHPQNHTKDPPQCPLQLPSLSTAPSNLSHAPRAHTPNSSRLLRRLSNGPPLTPTRTTPATTSSSSSVTMTVGSTSQDRSRSPWISFTSPDLPAPLP